MKVKEIRLLDQWHTGQGAKTKTRLAIGVYYEITEDDPIDPINSYDPDAPDKTIYCDI